MALNLSGSREPFVEFYGRNTDQMPLLISDKRIPLSVKGLMERRLEVLESKDKDLTEAWLLNYFDTGDAIVYHPDGRIKVVYDSHDLRSINSQSKLSNGALVLANGSYERLDGQEFAREGLEKYAKPLRKDEVKANPLWNALARGDKDLLSNYTDAIFVRAKELYKYDENMGIYLTSPQNKQTMRSWFVGGLNSRSDAGGDYDLGIDSGRLVGVAPEAQSSEKNLEDKIKK